MKKMRRLIPAVAMLMVAAVMLSTASFAWFTMNTQVTATGMNVQAKSAGSLVIGDAPLKYSDVATEVDFASATAKLYPMTWDDAGNSGWLEPGEPSKVDPTTGKIDETDSLGKITFTGDNAGYYYMEQEFYIASAGEARSNQYLTFTLKAPVRSTDKSSLAYSAAIYVITDTRADEWADGATVGYDAKPDAIIHVDEVKVAAEGHADGRHTVTLKGTGDAGYNIPSIVGIGAQDNSTTGIKVIVRIFVDGNLESVSTEQGGTKPVVIGYEYKAATVGETIQSGQYFYIKKTDDKGTPDDASDDTVTYEPAVIPEGTTTVQAGWYLSVPKTENQTYKYVNSKEVPTVASQLEIVVAANDKN